MNRYYKRRVVVTEFGDARTLIETLLNDYMAREYLARAIDATIARYYRPTGWDPHFEISENGVVRYGVVQ